jgi:hypothetical protein
LIGSWMMFIMITGYLMEGKTVSFKNYNVHSF